MSWAHWPFNNFLGTLASHHCNHTFFKMGVQNLVCYTVIIIRMIWFSSIMICSKSSFFFPLSPFISPISIGAWPLPPCMQGSLGV